MTVETRGRIQALLATSLPNPDPLIADLREAVNELLDVSDLAYDATAGDWVTPALDKFYRARERAQRWRQ